MAGVSDEETEHTFSIQDYLKEVEEQELEADLVLGGDEGKECTYNNGYMTRQAIFSCLTCTPDGNAGVCTACSLSCHDGHEIVELWTKRNFRCDCGNSRFGEFFCKINPNKDTENLENSYNHNFKGIYCTCNRPYPDPDAEEQVEMIQCCICEDWFHEEHLGLNSIDEIPRDEEGEPLYDEFICGACSVVCSFLRSYPSSIWAAAKQSDAPANSSKEKHVLEDEASVNESGKLVNDIPSHNSVKPDPEVGLPSSDSVLGQDDLPEKNPEKSVDPNQNASCVLGITQAMEIESPVLESKPMFLSKNWRDVLCRCEKCVNSYKAKQIGFLLEKDDSIAEYEKMAKQKRDEKIQQQEGAELNMFNNLGHVEKIELLNGIADMKDEIRSFLESFDSSKPITSEDVHQVFDNLAKKRRRAE